MRVRFPLSFRDRDLALLARGLLTFALIGASLALAIEQLTGSWVTAFVSGNSTLGRQHRSILLGGVGIGVVAGVLAAVLAYGTGREGRRLQRLSRFERLAAPLLLAGLVPGLMRPDAWPDALTLAVLLTAFVVLLERLLRVHFEVYAELAPKGIGAQPGGGGAGAGMPPPSLRRPSVWRRMFERPRARLARAWRRMRDFTRRWSPRQRRNAAAIVVGAMAVAYVAYMSFYTLRNHYRFNSYTWDLGQINNQFYNFLHGHPFRCPALIREGNWSELRNHAEATMFFLLPIYALWPRAETLLVLQAVLMGAAGIFLYRFAARRITRSAALALTGAYYLYPPLHGAQFFDIHFQPVAAAFLLAAIDCFDARRMRLFALLFVLAICCREDISVGTAVFGLFLIVTGHRARAGVVIVAVSLAYFVLVRFVVMPAFGTWGFAEHYSRLFPAGSRSFAGIVKTIVTNPAFTLTTLFTPEKLRYTLQILLPLAFLPVRRPHLAMSMLPGAYFTLLTTGYGPTLDIAYQYSGYFIPYIFPAAALALQAMSRERFGTSRRRAGVATLIVATVLTTAHWGAVPPRKAFRASFGWVSFEPPTAAHEQQRRDLHELERMVPRDAILAVTDREMPHVANRVECWNFSSGFQGADYVIYTTEHPISSEVAQFQPMMQAGYIRVAERPGLLLLKRPGAR